MPKVINKKVVSESGKYLGKVKDLNLDGEGNRELFVKISFFDSGMYIDLDDVIGVSDRIVVEKQIEEENTGDA